MDQGSHCISSSPLSVWSLCSACHHDCGSFSWLIEDREANLACWSTDCHPLSLVTIFQPFCPHRRVTEFKLKKDSSILPATDPGNWGLAVVLIITKHSMPSRFYVSWAQEARTGRKLNLVPNGSSVTALGGPTLSTGQRELLTIPNSTENLFNQRCLPYLT